MKNEQIKFQSALFSPPGRWTGNNFLFKGGLGREDRTGEIYQNSLVKLNSSITDFSNQDGYVGLYDLRNTVLNSTRHQKIYIPITIK